MDRQRGDNGPVTMTFKILQRIRALSVSIRDDFNGYTGAQQAHQRAYEDSHDAIVSHQARRITDTDLRATLDRYVGQPWNHRIDRNANWAELTKELRERIQERGMPTIPPVQMDRFLDWVQRSYNAGDSMSVALHRPRDTHAAHAIQSGLGRDDYVKWYVYPDGDGDALYLRPGPNEKWLYLGKYSDWRVELGTETAWSRGLKP